MKRLLLVSLTAFSLTIRGDMDNDAPGLSKLEQECALGRAEAASAFINNNSKLSEIKQKLEDEKWVEQELLGLSLLPLWLECKNQGKNCKKFVKQVERQKLYDELNARRALTLKIEENSQEHHG